jgi:PAT family beta-lactamase induction signal transducer AmpG
MVALLLLGFSSGLPFLLTSKTLQAWMTVEGIKLSTIGLFSLVALPYSLKFLWAPLLDRFVPPFLGRRRGWLLISQIALLGAIAAMSLQNPARSLQFIAVNALVISFLSATQDVAADAYRTDILEKSELGAGAAVFVTGYRIALLVTGALAFFLADRISWQPVYAVLALLMSVGMIAAWLAPEPEQSIASPTNFKEAVIDPFLEFFQRLGVYGLFAIAFIILYKFGDSLLSNMATSFLLKTGFSQTDIGAIQGGMGIAATIVGTLLGGAIFSKIGVNRSLWVFGGLQALSNLAYLILAQLGRNYPFMVVAINIENFCTGLGNAAFLAFMMSLCNQRFSATQFALLSSLMAVSRDILVARAGELAEWAGWTNFFWITILAAIPGLLLLPFFAPWNGKLPSDRR